MEPSKIIDNLETKKISLNIDESILKMTDEFAEILNTNRTQVLSAVIPAGIKSQVNYNIKTWGKLKKDKNYQAKKEKINNLISKNKTFKDKWNLDLIPQ
ncbi:MAG: hypothetical protein ABFQ65_00665 [Nanoarchaeota archaeon]